MTHLPYVFARCVSAHWPACSDCLRNINVSPLGPTATRTVWIGPWVMDTPCESRVPPEGAALNGN